MAEVGFHERSSVRSGYRARDASPDSVIFTLESNFSLFSSASASVDRCSFASDAHDHDSLASEISLHLAGHDRDHNESLSGPDLDPNKPGTVHKHGRLSRKGEKVKVQNEATDALIEDDNQLTDSARSSFSLAVKECQERRSRSEALCKKLDRQRPASIDLNNVAASSPRLGNMKKSSVTGRKSGAFPSPGTPNYGHTSVGMQKGWSSERVPLHGNDGKMQVSATLVPLNSGRTLPSKWEDAERWICSPVSGDARQSIAPPQRRPKSKSGPLGPPGVAYYSLYSPAVPMLEEGNVQKFMAGSPFSSGVIAADGSAIHSVGHGGAFTARTEPCMARSVSVHGCSVMLNPPYLPSQDEKPNRVKDMGNDISHDISRRDMATQMSPQGSNHSSPEGRPSFSPSTLSPLPIVEVQSIHSYKSEVRDVQVDERVTMTRWSKKNKARNPRKCSDIVDDWRKKAVDVQTSTWDVPDTAKNISKIKREEAKITAWENLQKAKAEAAIRKLEMKLEKKRSSSMDKIMNKLRSAQKRAQEMRSSMLANQANRITRTSYGAISLRRTRQMGSLSGCFTCHAF
ncbi:hypothetical protein SLEP1_g16764 [Rubroshorea leprosula]|uniref:Remorin C-terminal domain-containing protein n=1 Tax=Rubroshorea leprosula TaxID=152421 RepID=A0AAV5J135_9ROSI|nr:hypothetical protein SLEP1_g16764 [Rubroshorea leprosula]